MILSLEQSQGADDSEDSRRKLPWKELAAEHSFRFTFDLPERALPPDDAAAVQAVLALLSPCCCFRWIEESRR